VAVARALAVAPSLLLLDEPFSALDRKLREDMQVDLRRLLADRGITTIFVTHDQEEAMVLSDRIAVMRNGQIEQFADATTLYRAPASRFVFEFVGQSTVLSGTVLHAADGWASCARLPNSCAVPPSRSACGRRRWASSRPSARRSTGCPARSVTSPFLDRAP
jgi:putative spermidine/putrescine transport system ATP-binding protein